jgi:hypothetical protein
MIPFANAEDLWNQRIVNASLVTCEDFGRLTLPRALVAIGWVGGFYAGRKNDVMVDLQLFLDRAERVIAFCRENPSLRLEAVVEQEMRSPNIPSVEERDSRERQR